MDIILLTDDFIELLDFVLQDGSSITLSQMLKYLVWF